MLSILKEYDKLYANNFSYGRQDREEVFDFENRNSKLILSAPHSTRTFLKNKEKLADLYTGAITKYVGEFCGVSTIIRNKYEAREFFISDYVFEHGLENHYFVDVHGFDKNIDYDVCLGIYKYKKDNYPYLDEIVAIGRKYGLKVAVNYPKYTGKGGFVEPFQEKTGKPNIIQMELKRYLRDFYQNPDIVEKITIPMMIEIANCYKK